MNRIFTRQPVSCTRSAGMQQHRCYAIWVEKPRVFRNRSYPRQYNPKTVLLKDRYQAILQSGKPLLFVKHKDFKAKQLIKLRTDITNASLRSKGKKPAGMEDGVAEKEDQLAQLIGVRTTVLGVALRECEYLDKRSLRALRSTIGKGALFILALHSLDPIHLSSLIRVLDRAAPPKRLLNTPQDPAPEKQGVDPDFVPGKEQKRVRPIKVPELQLVGALLEGKPYAVQDVRQISKSPSLDVLRSQIVGLISRPGAQVAELLSQAAGGQLVRTLQGYQQSLQEKDWTTPNFNPNYVRTLKAMT